jgi:hypothetical protein
MSQESIQTSIKTIDLIGELSDAIRQKIDWDESSEGYMFWADLYVKARVNMGQKELSVWRSLGWDDRTEADKYRGENSEMPRVK